MWSLEEGKWGMGTLLKGRAGLGSSLEKHSEIIPGIFTHGLGGHGSKALQRKLSPRRNPLLSVPPIITVRGLRRLVMKN